MILPTAGLRATAGYPHQAASATPTRAIVAALLATLLVTGCASTARPLMPTPALYARGNGEDLFAQTPADRRTTAVDLLFVTDRALAKEEEESSTPYGEGRANSLAFGSAVVNIVPGLGWAGVEEQSRLAERTRAINLELGTVSELGRFPTEPYDVEVSGGAVRRAPDGVARHGAARAALQQAVQRKLETAPSGRVMLYVHGFNETFQTAAFTAAELCHFLGRRDVCAFFTWPASSTGGFLTSYVSTTESAEFAVNHLRKAIRAIATTPGVEGIQLLAHSRGADVVLSAMELLLLEAVAYGVDPADQYKIENVVLMAPDVDIDVASKRLEVFVSDPDLLTRLPPGRAPRVLSGGRLTVYTSPDDKALGASKFLFRSRSRLGQLSEDRLNEKNQAKRDIYGKVDVIDVVIYRGERTDRFGHAYFASNPLVSADLVSVLRYGHRPGDPERALVPVSPPLVWAFEEQ